MVELRDALLNANQFEIPIELGDLDTSIRFVETHYRDLKTILNEVKSVEWNKCGEP